MPGKNSLEFYEEINECFMVSFIAQTHTSTSDLKSTATIVSNKENMNAVCSGKSPLNCNADSNFIVSASVVAPVVLTTEGNLSKKTVVSEKFDVIMSNRGLIS